MSDNRTATTAGPGGTTLAVRIDRVATGWELAAMRAVGYLIVLSLIGALVFFGLSFFKMGITTPIPKDADPGVVAIMMLILGTFGAVSLVAAVWAASGFKLVYHWKRGQ